MVMVNDKRKYNKKMQCQIFKSDFQICISVPLKKGLWHMCFPVNFVKFVRKPFLIDDTSGAASEPIHAPSSKRFATQSY